MIQIKLETLIRWICYTDLSIS